MWATINGECGNWARWLKGHPQKNKHGIAYTWGKDCNAYKLNRMSLSHAGHGRNWERLIDF